MPASLSDLSPFQLAVLGLQSALGLTCFFLVWRDWKTLAARLTGRAATRLSPPPYPLVWLAAGAAFAVGGGVAFNIAAGQLALRWFAPAPLGEIGHFEMLVGGATQLGVLAGLAHLWFWHLRAHRRPEDAPRPANVLRAVVVGARAVVTLLPVMFAVSFLWHSALEAAGYPPEPQPLVVYFAKTKEPLAIALMAFFAVIIAPVTEELVFRAGIFRALRGHVARSLALLLPSVFFAAIHDSFTMLPPLLALAVGLSLAYEETGHPLTPITAHALFNLNTLLLVLAGFGA